MVSRPDVRPIESDIFSSKAAAVEHTQIRAVAGAQFGQIASVQACDPDIFAIGGESPRAGLNGEILDDIGLIELLRVCRWDGKPAEKHDAHRRRSGDKEQRLTPLFEYLFHL